MMTSDAISIPGKKEILVLFLFLLMAGTRSPAQNPYIRHYTTSEGLPSNVVYQVYQDSHKFIWFATDAGVARFDGSAFAYFNKRDGLSSNEVVRIKEDSRGRIWFFNLNASLNYLYNNTIYNEKNAPFLDSLKSEEFFHDFYEDEDQTICFYYNYQREIYALDSGNRIIKYKYPSILVNFNPSKTPYEGMVIRSMNRSASGDYCLWAIKGLFKLDDLAGEPVLVSDAFTFRSVFPVSQNRIYAVTGDKKSDSWTIRRYIGDYTIDTTFTPILSASDLISSLWEVPDGTLWVSTFDKGVYCYRNNQVIHHFNIREGQAVIQDHENNIWISSLKDGAYKISPFIHQHTHYESSLFRDKGILALSEHMDHGLWCTNGETVYLLRDDEWYSTDFQCSDNSINHLLQINSRILLAGERHATLFALTGMQLNSAAKTIKFLKTDIFPNDVKGVVINKPKDKLCGFDAFILYFFNTQEPFRGTGLASMAERVYTIYYNTDNELLVNAKKNYLYRNDSLVIYEALSGFENKFITDHLIMNDTVELLNIEGNSLFLFYHQKLFNLTAAFDHSLNLQIRNMTYHDPMLFISTNQDILFCENPLNILKGDSVQFQPTGLTFRNIHDILCSDDRLYIASDDGLTAIPYDDIRRLAVRSPSPYFRSILINDREYAENHEENVIRGPARIQFHIGSIGYSGGRPIYSYFLQGADKDWSAGAETDFVYQDLPAGDYIFMVKVRTTNSDWSDPMKYIFRIRLPFWRHPAFYAALAILLGGAISLSVYFHQNAQMRIRELDHQVVLLEQKALQSIMNPHFIFNVLGSIQNFLLQNKSAEAGTYLLKFARLIRQNLASINASMVRLDDEIERIRNYLDLEKLRMGNKFDYSINKEAIIPDGQILIPSMILQPYVENAVWHGLSVLKDPGRIEILFSLIKPDTMQIMIRDNGIGMKQSVSLTSSSKQNLGMGIAMTRKRIEILGQKYQVEASVTISEAFPGRPYPGMRVEIVVPALRTSGAGQIRK